MAAKALPNPNDPNSRFKRCKLDGDEDDDERPSAKAGKPGQSGPSPFLFLGLAGVLAAFLGCCGGGTYLTFFSGSLFASNDITITEAGRQRSSGAGGFGPKGFLPGPAEVVTLKYKTGSGLKPRTKVVPIARIGSRTSRGNDLTLQPNSTGQLRWSTTEFAGATGKVEIWFEDAAGNKVSNVHVAN